MATDSINYDALDIPGLPTDQEFEAQVLGSDPRNSFVPHASLTNGKITRSLTPTPTPGARLKSADFAAGWSDEGPILSKGAEDLAKIGALGRGMGHSPNPYHEYLAATARREHDAWARTDKLVAEVSEVAQVNGIGQFNVQTGEPIYLMSPTRRAAVMNEIAALGETLARINGPEGAYVRQQKLAEGVAFERREFQRRYVAEQASKLATKLALDAKIMEQAKAIAVTRKYRGAV